MDMVLSFGQDRPDAAGQVASAWLGWVTVMSEPVHTYLHTNLPEVLSPSCI